MRRKGQCDKEVPPKTEAGFHPETHSIASEDSLRNVCSARFQRSYQQVVLCASHSSLSKYDILLQVSWFYSTTEY